MLVLRYVIEQRFALTSQGYDRGVNAMNQETTSPVLASTIATLKAAVVDHGPDVVLAALAEGGVFLPQHVLYKQIRETEGLLEAEQFAHANTGEELDRIRQALDAERQAHVDLRHQLQALKGDLTPPVNHDPVTVSEISIPMDAFIAGLAPPMVAAAQADTNEA